MIRRTALNRAVEDLQNEITHYDIRVDFATRTIASATLGITKVPRFATRKECQKHIKRHFRGTDWQNEQEEKSKQSTFKTL